MFPSPWESIMKILWVILTALLITFSFAAPAAQTAQATLFCWSFRFQQGENSFGDSTLDLSTLAGPLNGELAPSASPYTHESGFVLDWMGFPINGTIYLDLPPYADANGNGFDDSFEVSQTASGTANGEYTTALGGGLVNATWSRGAGSKDGTCSLRLVDDTYGDLGTFQHAFEVLEYTGLLTYTPGSNVVSGGLNVTNAADQLQGPLSFSKVIANPHNNLTLQTAFLTNVTQQIFSLFDTTAFSRDLALRTNYYGGVEFNDGDLNTGGEDYYSWELSIDDLNDSDHDGIPDFSDEPQIASPRQPVLSFAGTSTNLLLTISGDVNRLYHILESTNLVAGNWKTNLSLTLTNDPQTVALPLPIVPIKFWRALVP
jgi:hypothetical protein